MAWLFIVCADAFEIAWPFILKWSAPLSRWAPFVVVLVFATPANFLAPFVVVLVFAIPANFLLAEAGKRLPAATVYAMLVGIGTAGTAIVGMTFFRESTNLGHLRSLILIIIGIIGLWLFSGAADRRDRSPDPRNPRCGSCAAVRVRYRASRSRQVRGASPPRP